MDRNEIVKNAMKNHGIPEEYYSNFCGFLNSVGNALLMGRAPIELVNNAFQESYDNIDSNAEDYKNQLRKQKRELQEKQDKLSWLN